MTGVGNTSAKQGWARYLFWKVEFRQLTADLKVSVALTSGVTFLCHFFNPTRNSRRLQELTRRIGSTDIGESGRRAGDRPRRSCVSLPNLHQVS